MKLLSSSPIKSCYLIPGLPWGAALLLLLFLNLGLNIVLLRPGAEYVYDDREAILNNPDLNTDQKWRSWYKLWQHDFWGTPITSPYSHKSYRPITVLTYVLQRALGLPPATSFRGGGQEPNLDGDGSEEEDPFYFKLFNFTLHIFNCFLVLALYQKIYERFAPKLSVGGRGSLPGNFVSVEPLLGAIMFAIHPIHVEAVASVVGRAELLANSFGMASLLVFDSIIYAKSESGTVSQDSSGEKGRTQGWVVCRWVAFVCLNWLAVFSKEQAISYPFICIVYHYLVHRSVPTTRDKSHYASGLLLTLLTMIASIGCVRMYVAGWHLPSFKSYDNPAATFAHGGSIMRSLNLAYHATLAYWIVLYPGWSSYDWSAGCVEPIVSALDYRVALTLSAIALVTVLALTSVKYLSANPDHGPDTWAASLLFGMCLTFVPFLPASNLFYYVGFVVAERVMYGPSIGACWILARAYLTARYFIVNWAGGTGSDGHRHYARRRKVPYLWDGILAITLLSTSARTVIRNREWHTQASLYYSAYAVCPRSAKVLYNAATSLSAHGRDSLAERAYLGAMAAFPSYPLPYNNLAVLYISRGQMASALPLLDSALSHEPRLAVAWLNKGIALSATGAPTPLPPPRSNGPPSTARSCYERALEIAPDLAGAHFAAAALDIGEGRYASSIYHLERCLGLRPRYCSAWKNLLNAHLDSGNATAASARIREATAACPRDTGVLATAALVFARLHRYGDSERAYLSALQHLESGISFDGKSERDKIMERAELYGNLGVLYHKMGKSGKAVDFYQFSLRLHPDSELTKANLRKLMNSKATVSAGKF